MTLEQLLRIIDELKSQADSYKPLKPEQEQRLMQKIRLEWNYHSNHIEGNQLSFGETKNLLLWGITAKGKPLKDHLEIQGHEEAIEYLIQQIKTHECQGITQTLIRNLHQLILKQNYQVPARTPDGKEIMRTVHAGVYKTTPNHVLTATGKTFYFATPEETPAKMTDLVDWFQDIFAKKEIHPLLVAINFHYLFVRIHPFDDGNGRMARLLMNFILMMYGFPPLIVPTEEREEYLAALELSDEQEDVTEFALYMGKRLQASLEMYIKAAKGESIDEPDDLDKAVDLLKRKFPPKVKKTSEQVEHVFDKYIIPFLKILAEKLSKLDSLFFSKGIVLYLDGEKTYPVSNATDISGGLLFYQSIYTKTLQEMLGSSTEKLRFTYNLFDMLYEDNKLNFIVTVEFHFKSLYYIVDATASEPRKPLKLYYDSIFTLEEMDEIATTITKSALADIEEKIDAFHRHADN